MLGVYFTVAPHCDFILSVENALLPVLLFGCRPVYIWSFTGKNVLTELPRVNYVDTQSTGNVYTIACRNVHLKNLFQLVDE